MGTFFKASVNSLETFFIISFNSFGTFCKTSVNSLGPFPVIYIVAPYGLSLQPLLPPWELLFNLNYLAGNFLYNTQKTGQTKIFVIYFG